MNADIILNTHQTTSRYNDDISEFDTTDLKAIYLDNYKTPFVSQTYIKIACEYVYEYSIRTKEDHSHYKWN